VSAVRVGVHVLAALIGGSVPRPLDEGTLKGSMIKAGERRCLQLRDGDNRVDDDRDVER
jgi:hypothetical protein